MRAPLPPAAPWGLLLLGALSLGAPGCVLLSAEDIAARKDLDGDGLSLDVDCDDDNPNVGLPKTYTLDGDGDGFAGEEAVEACARPAGAAELTGDCDDDNPLVFPGAPDAPYDGLDADCLGEDANVDGIPDDFDQDGDGEAAAPEGADCDDGDPAINTAALELCDGVDNDCDELLDADDPDLDPDDFVILYPDADGDGFGLTELAETACSPVDGYAYFGGDCDDDNASVHPEATELCNLGIDDDCDGLVDADDPDVDESSAPAWFSDLDRDGYGVGASLGVSCEAPVEAAAPRDGDCDDGLPGVNPGAAEVCDGIDNDCDALVDDEDADLDAASQSNFYADGDGDRFGDPGDVLRACTAPAGRVAFAGDCDDTNPFVNPDAREVCNGGIDDDCDGAADDLDASLDPRTRLNFYADADLDGYGDGLSGWSACAAPSGTVANGDDCDDTDGGVNPGAPPEACDDGFDQNCDGRIEVCTYAALPWPAEPGRFEHQGVYTRFADSAGLECAGHIALAMGDQALCYVDPDDELRCAGRIYTQTFGPSFVATGLVDVEQVYIAPTVGPADGNGATVISAGQVLSFGYNNADGQLGTGDLSPRASWSAWIGMPPGVRRFATDFGQTYCAQNGAPDTYCVGIGFGSTPVYWGSGGSSLVVQPAGSVELTSSSRWRMAQGYASCSVGVSGLSCSGTSVGVPGEVVDGGEAQSSSGAVNRYVYLDRDGIVRSIERYSTGLTVTDTLFSAQRVLAIAYSRASAAVCAVYADGSLACVGPNPQGMLGTGGTADLAVETTVLPAGSIDTTCE